MSLGLDLSTVLLNSSEGFTLLLMGDVLTFFGYQLKGNHTYIWAPPFPHLCKNGDINTHVENKGKNMKQRNISVSIFVNLSIILSALLIIKDGNNTCKEIEYYFSPEVHEKILEFKNDLGGSIYLLINKFLDDENAFYGISIGKRKDGEKYFENLTNRFILIDDVKISILFWEDYAFGVFDRLSEPVLGEGTDIVRRIVIHEHTHIKMTRHFKLLDND